MNLYMNFYINCAFFSVFKGHVRHFNTSHIEFSALTFFALWSHPALHADLGTTRVTVEVTKEVIAGPAEFVAERSIVVGITAEAKAVFQAESPSVVTVCLPLFTGVQHGGQEDSLNQLT